MNNSPAMLWPELDDTLSDDEFVAAPGGASAPLSAASLLDPQHQLITPAAAARHLGRSVATIHRWVRERRLPAVKIGRSTLLRVDDVKAYIVSNLVSAIKRASTTKPTSQILSRSS